MSLLRDYCAEALSETYLDLSDSDPRADVPPVESAKEFGIGPDEPHSSDAARVVKNLPIAFTLQAFENIALHLDRRNYLVKGLIARTGLAVIWGPPKCGKSFWAFDLGMHIALGWDYRGHKVQQAPVVYLALEGRSGFPARKEAFRRYHGVGSAPFYLLTTSLDLVAKSGELIASIKAQLGETLPGIVFLGHSQPQPRRIGIEGRGHGAVSGRG